MHNYSLKATINNIRVGVDILNRDFVEHYVENAYYEMFRYYHGIEHIVSMLDNLNTVISSCNEKDLVEFAIWYHDVIYIPGFDKCEEASAKKAVYDASRLGFKTKIINKIHDLIIATDHSKNNCSTNDEKLIHDLDLLILAESADIYKIYVKKIREEYFFVKEKTFKLGRVKILKNFLENDTIYYHEIFKENCEEDARRNIQNEIEKLKKGEI